MRVGGAMVRRARTTSWAVRQCSVALIQVCGRAVLQRSRGRLRTRLTAVMHHLHSGVVYFGILDALVDGSRLATTSLRRAQSSSTLRVGVRSSRRVRLFVAILGAVLARRLKTALV